MGIFSFRKKEPEVRECPVVPEPESKEPDALSVIFGRSKVSFTPEGLSAWFAARELISNSIAMLPIVVRQDYKKLDGHSLEYLFTKNMFSKFVLMKKIIEDIIDYGQSLLYIRRRSDGKPYELVYCEPNSYSVNFTSKKQLYYSISQIGKAIEPINVLHFYKNSIFDGTQGVPLSSYAKRIIQISGSTDKAAQDYYKTGCTYKAALTLKGARKGAKERARQAFEEVNNGVTSSGLVILDDDMQLQQLSSDANSSQMLESRLFNVTEIARFFNISPVLLGDLSKSGYNTIEAANMEFVSRTLMPYISLWECEVNRKLIMPSEEGLKIDLDESYLLRGDSKTIASNIATYVSNGVYSRNHARSILGLEPVEGLDDIVIPYTKIEDNKLNKEENIDSNEDEESSRV